jgi:hypothetical protein
MLLGGTGLAGAAVIPMTFQDFHLPGTQVGGVNPANFQKSDNCSTCHGEYDYDNEPYHTWKGSLMGNAGRDPLFLAQMTTANQDVGNVGYFCLRCHVPMTFVTGHAYQPDGSTMDDKDRDGVTCHFCHSMVDPRYQPGTSPPEDKAILAGLSGIPAHYGNAMFVLDPTGTRRGPYSDVNAPHGAIASSFYRSSEMCGTCHEVGNVAVTKLPNGQYAYNAIDQPTPDENPCSQFPLERTYTEWKLSTFATTGVDMGGRFGGAGATIVRSCQDCHMPRAVGRGCYFGPSRDDLARHDFAGASSWVLEAISLWAADDPEIDQLAIQDGIAKARDMLERAATLEIDQQCGALHVRIYNESGHKLPTGHIEGRRVWLNVQFFDAQDSLVGEYGHYDMAEAHLDEGSTRVYEMHIGLSAEAAQATGYPAGPTTHMSLADIIVKDTRIPPRGFNNAAYEACGAPVVGASYADGQYWDDAYFAIPPGAVRAQATANYQTVTRHYIEALRDGNTTNTLGQELYDVWNQTNRGAPVLMTTAPAKLTTFTRGDLDCDQDCDLDDARLFVDQLVDTGSSGLGAALADLTGDGRADAGDTQAFLEALTGG